MSARHKSDSMAQHYAACARFGLETSTSNDPNASCQVGRFKMAINVHTSSSSEIVIALVVVVVLVVQNRLFRLLPWKFPIRNRHWATLVVKPYYFIIVINDGQNL
jgi:hypothetical protein